MEPTLLFQKLESLVVEALRTGPSDERTALLSALQLVATMRASQEKLPSLQASVSDLEGQVATLAGPPLRYGTFLGVASPSAPLEAPDPSWSTLEGLLGKALDDGPPPDRRERLERARQHLATLRAVRSSGQRLVVGIQGERYECLAADIAVDELIEGQRLVVNKELCVVGIRDEALVGETAEIVNLLSPPGAGRVLSLPKTADEGLRAQLLSGKVAELVCPTDLLAALRAGDIVQVDDSETAVTGRARPRLQVRTSGDQRMAIDVSTRLHREGVAIGDIVRIDSRLHIAFEKLPAYETGGLTLEEVPDVSYDDIGGLESQVEEIRDAIELPYIHRALFDRYLLQRPKGILLHGPPGCGKTLIAKAVANSLTREIKSHMARTIQRLRAYTELLAAGELSGEARKKLEQELVEEDIAPERAIETLAKMQEIYRREDGVRSYFLNVKGPELLNKYVGETEQRIRKVFEEAKRRATFYTPVVVFFDEMEAMFRARGTGRSSDVETTIVPQLLSELDGVEGTQHIIVIGASNRPELIDGAILRPGRLDAKIKVDRPDRRAAAAILGLYLTPDLPLSHAPPTEGEQRSPAVVFKKNSCKSVLRQLGAPDPLIDAVLATVPARCDIRRILQDGIAGMDEPVRSLLEAAARKEWCAERLILDVENLLYHPRSRIEATMTSHQRHVVPLHHFVSGAILANIIARAKKLAIKRHALTSAEGGLTLSDLRAGIEEEFRGSADQLVAERLRGEDPQASVQPGERVQLSTVHLGDGEQDVWSFSKADIYRA